MSELIEFAWLNDELSLKEALKKTFGSSGQLIKRYFSSREQAAPVKGKTAVKLPLSFVNHLMINPNYEGPEVLILSETEDVIILHKPPGIHCHPHSYEDQDTLLNFLTINGKWEALSVNQESYDRGLLYRLDYETSGVIVLAKNERYFRYMRENFDLTMKRKFYWAIVEGSFNKDGRWTHFFKPTGQKGAKQKVLDREEEEARAGPLSVMKLTENQGTSLVLVNLKTGLRHQIRAQLSFL
jgi:23S rRNA pseudouridine1911/1915/1917 synthase